MIDFQRARARRRRQEDVLPEDDLLEDASQAPAGAEGKASGNPRGELSPDMDSALAKLPQAQREAVWMIHVEGLSVVEAALRTRVSPGALRVRAHRGYRALRSLLGRRSP